MTQRIIQIESPFFIREEELSDLDNFSGIFDREAPLALEIGCGTGDFILQLAQMKPEINFLAIDIYNKGCYKTCRKAHRAGVNNIRVLRMEARHLISRYIRAESLQTVYINCPDPWPKKRHRRRRLVNGDFLKLLLYSLSPGGDFFFCTDFADYAQEVAELFPFAGFQNQLETSYVDHLEGYPLSKYMERFRSEGLPLYFMVQRKDPAFCLKSGRPPVIKTPFRNPTLRKDTWAKAT